MQSIEFHSESCQFKWNHQESHFYHENANNCKNYGWIVSKLVIKMFQRIFNVSCLFAAFEWSWKSCIVSKGQYDRSTRSSVCADAADLLHSENCWEPFCHEHCPSRSYRTFFKSSMYLNPFLFFNVNSDSFIFLLIFQLVVEKNQPSPTSIFDLEIGQGHEKHLGSES